MEDQMRSVVFDHQGGLRAVPDQLQREVHAAIAGAKVRVEKGCGGKIRTAISQRLMQEGWTGEMPVAVGSDITITSTKDGTGLCLQTGNVSRVYADLLKLQKLFIDGAIAGALVIIPSHTASKIIGSNVIQAARLQRELAIFQAVITVPIVVFSIE